MSAQRDLPLAVRKELLLTRAALERVELEEAVGDLRRAGRRLAGVSRLVGGGAGTPAARAILGALSLMREHPYLGTAASLAFGAVRGTRVGRWVRRLSLLAGVVAAGAWFVARRNDPPRD